MLTKLEDVKALLRNWEGSDDAQHSRFLGIPLEEFDKEDLIRIAALAIQQRAEAEESARRSSEREMEALARMAKTGRH